MSFALAVLLVAAEPVSTPAMTPVAAELTAPAPRWPAAFFFAGGGTTFWTGVGAFIKGGLFNFCGRAPCPSGSMMLAGGIIASVGLVSLLAGIFWLVWTRTPSEPAG